MKDIIKTIGGILVILLFISFFPLLWCHGLLWYKITFSIFILIILTYVLDQSIEDGI